LAHRHINPRFWTVLGTPTSYVFPHFTHAVTAAPEHAGEVHVSRGLNTLTDAIYFGDRLEVDLS
jgi:hypothetical protein